MYPFRMEATQRIRRLNPKSLKKIIETQNLPIKTKKFSKKLYFVPLRYTEKKVQYAHVLFRNVHRYS
jgi:hypothetical protein